MLIYIYFLVGSEFAVLAACAGPGMSWNRFPSLSF
jgi:hypothetical protein